MMTKDQIEAKLSDLEDAMSYSRTTFEDGHYNDCVSEVETLVDDAFALLKELKIFTGNK